MLRREHIAPFQVAVAGVVHTFRSQRHMRIHIYVTLITVMGAMLLDLARRELLVLLFMITFVLVAEMFNSAIEATIDLVSPGYHPLAKFAKDIAAGAVLITTTMAIIVGALIALGDENWERIRVTLTSDQDLGIGVVPRIVVGLFVVFLSVVVGKGLGKRGQVTQGGLVSGHAAFGFFLATCVAFLSTPLVGAIGVLLAGIVAQSRLEAKYHSIFELTLGAAVGSLVGILLFGLFPK